MQKDAAVIGGRVGGIPIQIQDGESGENHCSLKKNRNGTKISKNPVERHDPPETFPDGKDKVP